ncbi:MAG: lipid droplet-associated protein [Gordonia sp. (in: high G+C Gram-positive bacteria)]|uniref:lipid droplet-associated protein n=1 Tax=Gordonia sp. (in: high G+C Gram-positive bacteria) TaxID=84139 RepID=UPI0039E42022
MRRPPYPARVAAGVLVTALDETKRLPTRILTFPMTAVSRGLQAGMRLQQNIAEMAIKGDEFFAPWCERAEEQPEWARFDDDEPTVPIPAAFSTRAATAGPPAPEASAAGASPNTGAAPNTPVATAPTSPAAAAEKAPARKPAAKKSARKPAEKPAPAPPAEAALEVEPPNAHSGRFALYSSPPAGLSGETPAAPAAPKPAAAPGEGPAVVERLEYDSLTLAQLRAKLRGLSTEDLTELAAYERAHKNRTPFVTMIDNRIASHQKKSGV